MFWCVPHYLDAFETVWLPYGTRCKSGSRVGIFRNKRTRSTPLDPKLTFCCGFVLFGCIWDRLVALRNTVQNGPN